tara:strand:- start:40 stop:900 length:861 start_codon:yes stop_codon:yes gene_type:complete
MASTEEETKTPNDLESGVETDTLHKPSSTIDLLLEESRILLNHSEEITEPFQKSINLETSKEQMVIYLQTKIDKVTQRIRLVEHKYGAYKKMSDAMNIGIILLSTLLTLLESVKAEIGISEMSGLAQSLFNLSPILISTTITCIAAISKFKKLQEKMEGISKTVDKSIFAIARIKKCQEDILFLKNPDELDEVKIRYHKDIYEYYNACNQDIEKYLKIEDYGKYLKTLNEIDINILILERDKQKRERFIESDFSQYMTDIKEEKQKEKKNKKITLARKKWGLCLVQ